MGRPPCTPNSCDLFTELCLNSAVGIFIVRERVEVLEVHSSHVTMERLHCMQDGYMIGFQIYILFKAETSPVHCDRNLGHNPNQLGQPNSHGLSFAGEVGRSAYAYALA